MLNIPNGTLWFYVFTYIFNFLLFSHAVFVLHCSTFAVFDCAALFVRIKLVDWLIDKFYNLSKFIVKFLFVNEKTCSQ